MNTDQLVLQPEYIYMDAERKKVYFCCLPGYQKEIQGQLRGLTEYILPKLDHEDNQAVMLGYGIYRKALEPGFQLEVVKEAIYQKEDEADKNAAAQKEDKYQEMLSEKQENEIIDSVIPDEQKKEEIKNRKKEKRIPWNWILCCGAGGAAALAVLAAGFWGVIPKLPIEIVLGIGIMALGAGAFTAWITEKKKRKQEQTAQWHNKIKQETDSSPVSGQVRKEENIKKDPETIREERKAETSITGELFGTKKMCIRDSLLRVLDYPQVLAKTVRMKLPFHESISGNGAYVEQLPWSCLLYTSKASIIFFISIILMPMNGDQCTCLLYTSR